MFVRLPKFAAALRCNAAVQAEFGETPVGDVLDFAAIKRQKPPCSLVAARREEREDVWAPLRRIPAATDDIRLDRIVEIQLDVRV
jgi:hypothetical protein